jgi:O-antigen ligase
VVLFSMSRGGMVAMCITGAVAFILIPKRPIHYITLFAAVAVVLRLAGPQVQEEFFTMFQDAETLDDSALSRSALTKDAIRCMLANPFFGCGMENWRFVAPEYGWPLGKRVHNTWGEIGATLGIPGLTLILLFYTLCCWRCFWLARENSNMKDPWLRGMSRAVIAAIAGFFVAAFFLTVDLVEIPYYIMLIGAGVLKLYATESSPVTQGKFDSVGASAPLFTTPHPAPV